jgi:hypothetical protein
MTADRKLTPEEAAALESDASAQRSLTPANPHEHPNPGSSARDVREVDTTEYDESNAGEGPD